MDEPAWHQHLSLPALLRHARSTYGHAMRAALQHAGYDDIPGNGLYIIGGLALGAPDAPIGQLAVQLGITKQGAGQLVDTLVTRGYLNRTPDKHDRRRLVVTLTDRGREAAATQLAARQSVDAALLAKVGDAALQSTRRTLATLLSMGRQAQTGHHGQS